MKELVTIEEDTTIERMAKNGSSNAEIFGELKITAGTLIGILQTQPDMLFKIIQGRTEYINHYMRVIEGFANGDEEVSKVQYQAAVYCIDRAEKQNRQLTISHEVALTNGSPATASLKPVSGAKVTELLRKSK